MIVSFNTYHLNIICIKLNEIVNDPEVGSSLFDPIIEC